MINIAVIPARGGSKRIPRKNIRDFCGKPMIAWSIEAARQTPCIDTVIVSTDDEEIADIARSLGAAVPFMRPPELADDYVGTTAVIRHAVQFLTDQGTAIDSACCLYATAPFVRPQDLAAGHEALQKENVCYAFSVTTYDFPIQRALRLTPAGGIAMFDPAHEVTRSQDLEVAFHDAGQFYWGKKEAWLQEKSIYASHSVPVMLTRSRVQDIDTPEDWEQAELMFHVQMRKNMSSLTSS